ncbi:hypothetical protein CRG98_032779 [Punica granatum]|uniref:CCHC-type domain-containing protein n=1 Tax=Punica granatum TaxID=22663 RepID=A0A2I0IS69_PUNGR|nr:hypothetical protein CRG98_032779 [Punica granatum]
MASGNDGDTTNGSQTTGSGPAPILPNHLVSQNVTTPSMVPVNHVEKPEKFNGLNFKRWTVMSQVQEFQVLLHETQAEGMALSESFQVAVVIEKLPPGWKDVKNYLKHKRKEMTIEDLVVKLQIEEDNKNSGKDLIHPAAKVNVMEQGQSSKNKKGKKKLGRNGGIFKPKFQGKCFNCDKKGHRFADCRLL